MPTKAELQEKIAELELELERARRPSAYHVVNFRMTPHDYAMVHASEPVIRMLRSRDYYVPAKRLCMSIIGTTNEQHIEDVQVWIEENRDDILSFIEP